MSSSRLSRWLLATHTALAAGPHPDRAHLLLCMATSSAVTAPKRDLAPACLCRNPIQCILSHSSLGLFTMKTVTKKDFKVSHQSS